MITTQVSAGKFCQLTDGNRIFYHYHFVSEELPALVFLNGLSQSTASWAAITPAFTGKYNILLLDFVFQGKSSAEGPFRSYDQHAADLMQLIGELRILHPVLCGLSYGSAVAQHALVNYPDQFDGAVLMSTFGHNAPVFDAIGESWKSALLAGGYALMLDVMLPVVLGASYFERPLIPVATLKEMRVSNDLSADQLLKLMQATETRGDYREKLRSVTADVLIIHGKEDLLIPVSVAAEVADRIPTSEMIVLEQVGHTLNLEAIPQVTRLIGEYVENRVVMD
jgi:3-oxoadipate enol-lactonase